MTDDLPEFLERATRGDSSTVESLLAEHLPALRAFVRVKAGALLLQKESSAPSRWSAIWRPSSRRWC